MDFKTDAEFHYAEIRQTLKVRDLKRYSINALLIDEYSQITEVLTAIQKKITRSNIFISGAAKVYTPKTEVEALAFIHKLSNKIAANGYKIISGFGYGVGSAVINGALDYIFSSKYRHLDDALMLRPFPQVVTGSKTKAVRNMEYRTDMLKNAGIAIFIFGNKDDMGGVKLSNGVMEEFDIAINNKVIPIPVGATGYAAEELWKKVTGSPLAYYPNNSALLDTINKIGDKGLSDDELINHILRAVALLQNEL